VGSSFIGGCSSIKFEERFELFFLCIYNLIDFGFLIRFCGKKIV
jgi:hypothetical protein